MRKAIAVFVVGFALLPVHHPATAQQVEKVYRIGFLTAASPVKAFKARMAAFWQGPRELGYL